MQGALRKHKDAAYKAQSKGRLDKALKHYQEAIALDRDDLVLRQRAADCLAKLGKTAQAIVAYQGIAGRYALEGMLLKAVAINKVILQLDPQHKETQASLADLYALQNGTKPRATKLPASMAAAGGLTAGAVLSRPAADTGEASVGTLDFDIDTLDASFAGDDELSFDIDVAYDADGDGDIDADDLELIEARELDAEVNAAFAALIPEVPGKKVPVTAPEAGMSDVPLFSALGKAAFAALVGELDMRTVPAGHTVIQEGDVGSEMFVLVQGTVDIQRAENGASKTVASLAAGAFFGEIALMGDCVRLASVVASSPSVLLVLTKAHVDTLSAAHKSFARILERFYHRRLLENLLRASPTLSALPTAAKEDMLGSFKLRMAKNGDRLVQQGIPVDGLYLVLRGRCHVDEADMRGNHRLTTLREGAFFGEISLLGKTPATASVTAASDAVFLRLHRRSFNQFIATHPSVRAHLEALKDARLDRSQAVVNTLV